MPVAGSGAEVCSWSRDELRLGGLLAAACPWRRAKWELLKFVCQLRAINLLGADDEPLAVSLDERLGGVDVRFMPRVGIHLPCFRKRPPLS